MENGFQTMLKSWLIGTEKLSNVMPDGCAPHSEEKLGTDILKDIERYANITTLTNYPTSSAGTVATSCSTSTVAVLKTQIQQLNALQNQHNMIAQQQIAPGTPIRVNGSLSSIVPASWGPPVVDQYHYQTVRDLCKHKPYLEDCCNVVFHNQVITAAHPTGTYSQGVRHPDLNQIELALRAIQDSIKFALNAIASDQDELTDTFIEKHRRA